MEACHSLLLCSRARGAMLHSLAVFVFFSLAGLPYSQEFSFTFNGFRPSNFTLDGIANINANGILELTNLTEFEVGHAFYKEAVRFRDKGTSAVFSFSSVFVFAIRPQFAELGGHGLAFVVSPTRGRPGAGNVAYLGLFNASNNGNDTNHVFAVELDTFNTKVFHDINDNHVGIDINDLKSVESTPAGYFSDRNGQFRNLSLISGDPMIVWVDYNGSTNEIEVTMAPTGRRKPKNPSLFAHYNLSEVLKETMYVGFSSSTDSFMSRHYVLGWSFKINGEAEPLTLSQLPKLPRFRPERVPKLYKFGLPLIFTCLILAVVLVLIFVIRERRKFAEQLEDWELDYGAHRFKYKDLYKATRGFRDLLGAGGFGRVFKGTLPTSKIEIAVKRVSHWSERGMKDFVAEIVSIGRMNHRNLVPLLGYCRRKGELLLVYSYMPHGSLDCYLYNSPGVTLSWSHRLKVIKGVASALLYLHEEWEQVVIHRDVKASNVLLDAEWNGRLGDFGLARLYNHGSDPQTTLVAGTPGYLAPELSRAGRASTSSDVFAFGAFLLEVACGRRPIEIQSHNEEDVFLVDWVFSLWVRGDILEAKDLNLGPDIDKEEVELVLKLGLLCSHRVPNARPSMRQVMRYLQGESPLPDLSPSDVSANGLSISKHGLSDFTQRISSSIADSTLSGGR